MAPEQFVNAKTAGVLCDIYSLGATLYNTLTGKVPFTAKTPMAILGKKMKGDYSPVRTLVPEVCKRVDSAIAAALSPDPNRRPRTCLEFFKLLTARDTLDAGPLRTISQPVSSTAPKKGANRRAFIRFPLEVGSCGVVDTGVHGESGFEESWPVLVRDVSAEGIGILLARRFETGTVLSVELGMGRDLPFHQLSCRVVRVMADRTGHWVHGCKFDSPLSPNDVKNLLKYA
jgi:serine/threonine protein kinase